MSELSVKYTYEFFQEAVRFRKMLDIETLSEPSKEVVKPRLFVVKAHHEKSKRIAVVDDDEATTLYLNELLRRRGFHVHTFQSSRNALQYIAENCGLTATVESPFDLVLVDYKMPHLDGISFIKSSKSYFPNIPMVLVTAYGSVDGAVDAFRCGAFDYIEKPISLARLDLVLKNVFEKNSV